MSRLDEFIEDCLREHNILRAKHGAPPLSHSRTLDKSAQEWADELISCEGLKNSPSSSRGEVGESISMRTSTGRQVDMQGSDVAKQWYADGKDYNFADKKGQAGNFTQLIWCSTREVGFGKAKGLGKCVVVAHYRPPGNIVGYYSENVLPPIEETQAEARPLAATSGSQGDIRGISASPRTVVDEYIKDEDGKKQFVRRETTETKHEGGKITLCVNEIYTDVPDKKKMDPPESTSMTNADTMESSSNCSTSQLSEKPMDFVQAVIEGHNYYRKHHGSQPLKYNEELTKMAQQWAEHLAQQSHLSNSGYTFQGHHLGENLGSLWSNKFVDHKGPELIDQWYKESERYKYDLEPDSIQGIGNFTQLVWAGSEIIGVGKANQTIKAGVSNSSKSIVVCLYYPPGNILGQFRKNVKPPKNN